MGLNPIVYAELAVALDDRADLDQKLELFERLEFPWEAAWVAARAFEQHLAAAGRKRSALCPLPNYFIRAHAIVANYPHLTLDTSQTSFFPGLRLVPLKP